MIIHRQGVWIAAIAALVALWSVIPGCRRVEAPKNENAASRPDTALSVGAMKPGKPRLITTPQPTPPVRPSSGRATVPPKKKPEFRLVRSRTDPPKPIPGCPKCGTKVPGRGVILAEGKLRGYTIRLYGEPFIASRYSIFRENKRLYDSPDFGALTFGSKWGTLHHTEADLRRLEGLPTAKRRAEAETLADLKHIKQVARWLIPGADVTGDGRPNLVVHQFSGGSWGSSTLEIFELAPRFRLLQKLDFQTIQGTDRDFADLDNDGFPEITCEDIVSPDWGTSPAESPRPRVVLKYTKGRYSISTALMQRPAPTIASLRKDAEKIRKESVFGPKYASVALWAKMLHLIYSGHAQMARRFFHMA